jgi:succinate dehydrogenase/fumarate reductase flavoprotein subunit
MIPTSKAFDVLVLGGGMAGLTAALAAIESGATVAVVEADAVPGGSARWSSGRVWTPGDYESLRRQIPFGDPVLQRVHSETLPGAIAWLSGHIALTPQPGEKSGNGSVMTLGRTGDRTEHFVALADLIRKRGAQIYLGAPAGSARRQGNGFAAEVTTEAKQVTVSGRSLVLATGGFQGDRAALESAFGEIARDLMVRSNPHSKGDGFRLGLALGGESSRGMDGFYGKTMPLHAGILSPGELKSHTLDVARMSIVVDRNGKRFVDETSGGSGEGIPNAAVKRSLSTYFTICDGSQAALVPSGKFRALARRAEVPDEAILIEAETAISLAEKMDRNWGVPERHVLQTIIEVNTAAESGRSDRLAPPRKAVPTALRTSPLIAVACQPAITIPFGGLHVDAEMRLLARDGSTVPGIFAVGADAGGVYVGSYGGGLAWALTSGLVAGRNASMSAARKVQRASA